MAHDVFISYSHEDKPVADAVTAAIEAEGVRCWVAPRDVPPGLPWGGSIIDAINMCRVMVLVFSDSSNRSRQVLAEVERAVGKGVVIIPFRIKAVDLSKDMEYYLSVPHWLDALTEPLDGHLKMLATKVRAFLGEAPAPPAETPRAEASISKTKSLLGQRLDGWREAEVRRREMEVQAVKEQLVERLDCGQYLEARSLVTELLNLRPNDPEALEALAFVEPRAAEQTEEMDRLRTQLLELLRSLHLLRGHEQRLEEERRRQEALRKLRLQVEEEAGDGYCLRALKTFARLSEVDPDAEDTQEARRFIRTRLTGMAVSGMPELLDDSSGEALYAHVFACAPEESLLEEEILAADALEVSAVEAPVACFRHDDLLVLLYRQQRGTPLEGLLGGGIPPRDTRDLERLCALLGALGVALHAMHQRGLVHGWLHPALVSVAGDQPVFRGVGAAPVLGARACGAMTPPAFWDAFHAAAPFMSPQLLSGTEPPHSLDDVYSLGAMLCLLLTGSPPYSEEELKDCVLEDAPFPALRDMKKTEPPVPVSLRRCIARALAPDRQDRHGSAALFAKALCSVNLADELAETEAEEALEAYAQGDVVRAYDLIAGGLDRDPGNFRLHHTRALIYFREGEHFWAIKELEGPVGTLGGKDPLLLLARCHLAVEDGAEKALRLLEGAPEHSADEEFQALLREARSRMARP